jgi:hypothetical protein
MRLVQEVAAYTDTDPLELPPLYDTIDPEGIDACVAQMDGVSVSFEFAGVPVTVESDGEILLGEKSAAATIWEAETSVQQAD